ncbi:hypothetical protein Glove_74g223 [Diversispora epigaea]|uniref:Uncharacterized protein n=1 Tax=Diversispora epigaea TaxID=1348612 RepID=A0A397JJ12_9GLOM|nr:hypothetical protein Glove_74g223 [Diversispora epigaea]
MVSPQMLYECIAEFYTDLWLRRINFSRNIRDNPLEQIYELALDHNLTPKIYGIHMSRGFYTNLKTRKRKQSSRLVLYHQSY